MIGVPHYDDEAIDDLPFIVDDLRELDAAFTSAGYQVEMHDPQRTHHDAVRQAIESFFDRAAPQQTQVVYLSGHGVHYRGRDYLVPASASTRADNFPESCLLLDFGHVIEKSRGGDVAVFVDACREGIHLLEKSTMNTAAWSRQRLARVQGRRVFYLYACGPGERAWFTPSPKAFSVLSRALSLAIGDVHGAATLEEFRVVMQATIDAIAAEYRLPGQKMHVLSEYDPAECVLVTRPAAPGPPVWSAEGVAAEGDLDGEPTGVPERAADEVAALPRILEQLESDLRRAAQQAEEALDHFLEPRGLLALADPDWLTDAGCGLRPWLADLQAAVRQGRTVDALIGARAWHQYAARAAQEVERLLEANSAPETHFRELRSRLRLYRAKAGQLGFLESAPLSELHTAARAALQDRPVDLDAAEQRIAEYARALSAPR
ncbi:caspase family protein [Frankia tisae]|uniref:caspase family protein n=1 Tax=Frankia tisae TaxID=2950104 RepID=UPI0021C0F603|nr:caspase family protein [Frankia tisae]